MFNVFKWIAYALIIIGALNWGFIGAFNFDLVSFIFGEMSTMTRIIYTTIGLNAILYMVLSLREDDECHTCNF